MNARKLSKLDKNCNLCPKQYALYALESLINLFQLYRPGIWKVQFFPFKINPCSFHNPVLQSRTLGYVSMLLYKAYQEMENHHIFQQMLNEQSAMLVSMSSVTILQFRNETNHPASQTKVPSSAWAVIPRAECQTAKCCSALHADSQVL